MPLMRQCQKLVCGAELLSGLVLWIVIVFCHSGVTGGGSEGDHPGWHPSGGWHPTNEKIFVAEFTENSGQMRSDTEERSGLTQSRGSVTELNQ